MPGLLVTATVPPSRRSPRPHVAEAHAAAGLPGVESDPVVLDAQLQAELGGDRASPSTCVARACRPTLASASCATRKTACCAPGRQAVARRKLARPLNLHLGAGTESQRVALLLQRLDEADVLERRRPELIEHRLHLGHRLARRLAHLPRAALAPDGSPSNRAWAVAADVWMAKICCLMESCRSRASRLRSSWPAAARICSS